MEFIFLGSSNKVKPLVVVGVFTSLDSCTSPLSHNDCSKQLGRPTCDLGESERLLVARGGD